MASFLTLSCSNLNPRRLSPLSLNPTTPRTSFNTFLKLAPQLSNYSNLALRLGSAHSISHFPLNSFNRLCTISPDGPKRLAVVSAKGYKMKTHKASAKRFRVTGKGKIVRRRAGKQHLLYKKNAKRRLRLSKMVEVSRSDYDNVIGALPYLKVNRQANNGTYGEENTSKSSSGSR